MYIRREKKIHSTLNVLFIIYKAGATDLVWSMRRVYFSKLLVYVCPVPYCLSNTEYRGLSINVIE